jgi:hypothetical protein
MKCTELDGGESRKQWHRTRRANLLKLSGTLPENLCVDQLIATVCSKYADSLLQKPRVKRYLAKYHAADLKKLETQVKEFEEICQVADHTGK